MKTKYNLHRKYGNAYCRKLKKKMFLEKWKVANRKLGNLGNLGNPGNIIPSFLFSKFSILPYSQHQKLGFKNLGKKFLSLRFATFSFFFFSFLFFFFIIAFSGSFFYICSFSSTLINVVRLYHWRNMNSCVYVLIYKIHSQ